MTGSGRRIMIVLAAAGWLAGSACTQATPPPAADVRAESEAAIKAADLAASAAANTRDVDKLASYYAEDTAFMPPNAPLMTGRESVRKYFSEMMKPADFSIAWQPTKVEAARTGDVGYSIGTYHLMFTAPDGKMVMDDGKYATVWKKQPDESWKLAVDMFNSNTPLPPPTKKE